MALVIPSLYYYNSPIHKVLKLSESENSLTTSLDKYADIRFNTYPVRYVSPIMNKSLITLAVLTWISDILSSPALNYWILMCPNPKYL